MGIKAFNHGNDFVNKFIRAIASDSTGLDAVNQVAGPSAAMVASGGDINEYVDGDTVYRSHVFYATNNSPTLVSGQTVGRIVINRNY